MAKTKQKRSCPRKLERGMSYTIASPTGEVLCTLTVGRDRQMRAVPASGSGVRIREVTPEADDQCNRDCSGK